MLLFACDACLSKRCVGRRKCFFFSWVWVGGRRRRKHLFGEEKEARARIIHVLYCTKWHFLSGECGAGFATKQEEQNSTKLKAKNQICQGIFRRAATLFLSIFLFESPPSKVNISPALPPAHERNSGDRRIFFFPYFIHSRIHKLNGAVASAVAARGGWQSTGRHLHFPKKKITVGKNLKIRSKVKHKQAGNYRTYNLQKFISDTASSSSIAVQ